MALADIVNRTRSVIYGTGLGEKPAIRRAAANANEALSGSILTFSVLAGEGASIHRGDVLSVHKPSVEADAHVLYVLNVSTDTITAVNGYLGSPAVVGADSGDLDNLLLEQRALVTDFEIFEQIETVFSNMLWPHVYDVVTATIAAPNLAFYQEAVPAEVEEIISAHQLIGSERCGIGFTRQPLEVHTSVASTGKLAEFDWINGSTGYYTYRAKYTEADEADTDLTYLVALGAAALCLGGTLVETTVESTKKDNSAAVTQRQAVGSTLWRDFLTLRQNMTHELSNRLPQQVLINRG